MKLKHWLNWADNRQQLLRMLIPTPGNILFTILALTLLVWAQSAGALPLSRPAAAPSTSTIAYQGRLASPNGTPINATLGMSFRLYNVASGGTTLWGETWSGASSVAVRDGLFNVMLGSLNAVPPSVISSNSSLWLGITIGSDSEMSPRVQLGSVPYATQALTVPDSSITSAKIADGTVSNADLAPNSVSTSKIYDANITTAKLADGSVTASKISDPSLLRIIGTTQTNVQYGSTQFYTDACDRIVVNFPQAFSQIPIVLISQLEGSAGFGNYVITTVTSRSFEVAKLGASNCTTDGYVTWLALGS